MKIFWIYEAFSVLLFCHYVFIFLKSAQRKLDRHGISYWEAPFVDELCIKNSPFPIPQLMIFATLFLFLLLGVLFWVSSMVITNLQVNDAIKRQSYRRERLFGTPM